MDESSRKYLKALSRAFAGAVIFGIPIMMTMETWSLGATLERGRLAAFLAFVLPLLVGLAYLSGFEETHGRLQAVLDAMTAYLVALVAASVVLLMFRSIWAGMSSDEIVGKLVLQASAGSFGAILAHSTLAGGEDEEGDSEDGHKADEEQPGYFAELLLMSAGALYLALNIAPTEEVQLIAARMGAPLVLLLMVLSLLLMHAFVYAVEFRGQEAAPEGTPMWSIMLRFTVVGYALAFLISLYVLWCFGRVQDITDAPALMMAAVLGFPASIGASSARLIL
jgi:putative integral membrane protein (TIGR02587 family)